MLYRCSKLGAIAWAQFLPDSMVKYILSLFARIVKTHFSHEWFVRCLWPCFNLTFHVQRPLIGVLQRLELQPSDTSRGPIRQYLAVFHREMLAPPGQSYTPLSPTPVGRHSKFFLSEVGRSVFNRHLEGSNQTVYCIYESI
jgi:hypothetical protein